MKKKAAVFLACIIAGNCLMGCTEKEEQTAGIQTEIQTETETEIQTETDAPENTTSDDSTEVTVGAVTFTDDLGREVTVENPQRVVTLIGSYADIWYLAGGVDQIVATTNATWTYFDLPLREDVVNLGVSKELNLEQLIACEPDLILASCGTDRDMELESAFEEMGLNVAYFSVSTFDDYLRMLKTCTEITG